MNTGVLEAPGAGFSIQQIAHDEVQRWSEICQNFLDWQQKEVIRKPEASRDVLAQHRTSLKWLLRFGRGIYLTASDPDYPDHSIANELRGRLLQLEHSWRILHEPRNEAEDERVLREVFPG